MVNLPQKYALGGHEYAHVVPVWQIHIEVSELESMGVWRNISGECLSLRFHPLHGIRAGLVLLFH